MEGLEWGKGEEPKKGGFPGPRLPVSNVQVPKFSWRSGGPLGIGESAMGTLKYLPQSRSPIRSPVPLFFPLSLSGFFLFLVLLSLSRLPSALINMHVHAQ